MTNELAAPAAPIDPMLLAVLAYLTARSLHGGSAVGPCARGLELHVLGPLDARRDGQPVTIPGATPRAILTLLALNAGRIVAADTLVAVLWGDKPPRTAPKALLTHISTLRRWLGDGVVLTQGHGWTLAATSTDTARFDKAAAAGRDALRGGNAQAAAEHFTEALHLWRGQPDLPDTPRGRSETIRWTEQLNTIAEDRTDALLACGQAAELIGTLELAVTETPLRERRWAQLMVALYRAGRQADALSAYRRVRAVLFDQLGINPSPGLRGLEVAILSHDRSLDLDTGRPGRPLSVVRPAA